MIVTPWVWLVILKIIAAVLVWVKAGPINTSCWLCGVTCLLSELSGIDLLQKNLSTWVPSHHFTPDSLMTEPGLCWRGCEFSSHSLFAFSRREMSRIYQIREPGNVAQRPCHACSSPERALQHFFTHTASESTWNHPQDGSFGAGCVWEIFF